MKLLQCTPQLGNRSFVLRLFQDVCQEHKVLPTSLRLSDVTYDTRTRLGTGGEAVVYIGTLKDERVAVRGFNVVDDEVIYFSLLVK